MSHLLEVKNLTTAFTGDYGRNISVDHVSFHVDPGEVVCIVGESGCGKSVTSLSIMGLLGRGGEVTDGSVWFDGKELLTMSEKELDQIRGNEMTMIFQDPLTSLNPVFTIGSQMMESIRIHMKLSKAEAAARAEALLKRVGMPDPKAVMKKYPHTLSGGMRQRVMIAMALCCDPRLLIADEPTTALDVTIQAQIMQLLVELQKETHMAMILITHDIGVVANMADRVLVMYAGQLIEAAPSEKLFAHPEHPYTRALLNTVPTIRDDGSRRLVSIPGIVPEHYDDITGCRFADRCAFACESCREVQELYAFGKAHTARCVVAHRTWEEKEISKKNNETERSDQAGSADREKIKVSEGRGSAVSLQAGNPAKKCENSRRVLVEVDHLKKYYPIKGGIITHTVGNIHAVDDVSLSIFEGETLGLVGESGCGKSTLLDIIAGLMPSSAGQVFFLGEPVIKPRKEIGYMLQRDQLFEWRSILRNTLLGPEIQHSSHKDKRKARKTASEMLTRYDLGGFLGAKPSELSGGMRQRAALIRTLIMEPTLLLLVEPFSALDYQTRLTVCNDICEIIRTNKKTAILVTHDLAEAVSTGNRVLVLGKRPSTIKMELVFDPDFTALSPLARRNHPLFNPYFQKLWEAFAHEK